MELEITGKDISGRYCYQKNALNIPLNGVLSGKSMKLNVEYFNSDAPTEQFVLQSITNGWKGTWKHNGKSLPVSLQKITAKDIPASRFDGNRFAAVKNLSDYRRLQAALYKLQSTDSIVFENGIKLRYFTETHTDVTLFRIDSGLPEIQLKTANEFMEYRHLNTFFDAVECKEYTSEQTADFEFSTSGMMCQQGLLCYRENMYSYCGGAHPNYWEQPFCLDLRNGVELLVNDCFTSESLEENTGETDEDENHPDNLTLFLFHYAQANYPEEMHLPQEGESDEERCPFYEMRYWNYLNFSFENDGMHILFDLPYVYNYCNDSQWAVFPYTELKQYIKPELFARLKQIKP